MIQRVGVEVGLVQVDVDVEVREGRRGRVPRRGRGRGRRAPRADAVHAPAAGPARRRRLAGRERGVSKNFQILHAPFVVV